MNDVPGLTVGASGEVAGHSSFDVQEVLDELKHYLPQQAPLKDFVHHNTLHAFQHLNFHEAVRQASVMFGYRTSLTLGEFRQLYRSQRIRKDVLEKIIAERKGPDGIEKWMTKMLTTAYRQSSSPRIGSLRSAWKRYYHIDLDSSVHPLLFRILCSYLDQGIAMWNFPVASKGFLHSIRELERNSFTSFFKTPRAKKLLRSKTADIQHLLEILTGDISLYKSYLFDQQFAHPGWSGMVSVIEAKPYLLLDRKVISLSDVIFFELLLEIDALDYHFGESWQPLAKRLTHKPVDLFAPVEKTEYDEVIALWQEAFEWSYHDEVLAALQQVKPEARSLLPKSFQAMFCIDDRATSFRDYLERFDPDCETFATPGFFNVEFFYQPLNGKFYAKQCPAPVTPKYLIKETGRRKERNKDSHLAKPANSLFRGWLISQTLGFWSALRLFLAIFRPSVSPATSFSFRHMDKFSNLTIENKNPNSRENDLQIGFTVEEMADRVGTLLRSIGLTTGFAPLVYVVGHGSSSVNNPHYAAYDCGACAGKPGSVNARVFCYMANHRKVREILKSQGLVIPDETQFVGALHDTTRDEILFFDEQSLSPANAERHHRNEITFAHALEQNACERARRFETVDIGQRPEKIHEAVKRRSVSLFEPRPELNHATNAVCIIGRRSLTRKVFLDRRSFMNSYDYTSDPDGTLLHTILKSATPVCAGINLEYYFSRVDNQKLGAGTKLPHNVMGLFGVANGIEGDLRPGLPSQMIEVHDPLRLLFIVEHSPEVVLETVKRSNETYEWYYNEWVKLVALDPATQTFFVFRDGMFTEYQPLKKDVGVVPDITPLLRTHRENLPVHLIA